MNNDKAISVLNNLIETCKDGEYRLQGRRGRRIR